MTALFLLSAWSNMLFKQWWHRPRPFQVSPRVQATWPEHSYGIPSGHTQNAVAVWGVLVLRWRTRWVAWAVLAFAVLMAISRMAVGVHYPQDVAVGALLGLGWLGVYLAAERYLVPWMPGRPLRDQAAMVVGMALLMAAIHPGLVRPDGADPVGWKHAMQAPGAMLGLGLGFVLEPRWVGFSVAGPWHRRALRFAVGLAVLIGLRVALKLPYGEAEPPPMFHLARYLAMGLWASLGAPWLFVRTGLAPRRVVAESSVAEPSAAPQG